MIFQCIQRKSKVKGIKMKEFEKKAKVFKKKQRTWHISDLNTNKQYSSLKCKV